MSKELAHITGSMFKVLEYIPEMPAVLPFGPDMYAYFCTLDPVNIAKMVKIKERSEKKPFVRTTETDYFENILVSPGISHEINQALLTKIGNFLKLSHDYGHPLGVLLPASDNQDLHPQLVGKQLVSVGGKKHDTVGFMVAPDKDFSTFTQYLNQKYKFISVGTSANISGDQNANGSGHHRLAGILAHFGEKPCVIFVPRRIKEGNGPSTSTVFIDTAGKAYLNRIGSTPKNTLQQMLNYAGLEFCGFLDGGEKTIGSYQYPANSDLAMWCIYKIFQARTMQDSFSLNKYEARIIKAIMPPPILK